MANIPVEPRRRPVGLMLVAVLLAIVAVAAVWYLTRNDVAERTETTEAPETAPSDPLEDAAETVGDAAESAGEAVQEAAESAAEAVGDVVDPGNK